MIVDSGKGGTGKSFTTVLLTSHLGSQKIPCAVVECDFVNPDVLRRVKPLVPVSHIDVRERGGWLEILEVVQGARAGVVLVNLPSNVATANIDERRITLTAIRDRLGNGSIGATLLWTLDTTPDVITLLQNELVRHRGLYTHVALLPNEHTGSRRGFAKWQNSPLRTKLLELGAAEAWLPQLWEPHMHRFMYDYTTPLNALRTGEGLDLGTEFAFADWFAKTDDMWHGLLPALGITTAAAA